ncbi:MAG TPA: TonB C-terminal domain-containing protein [Rhodanobacteraceae bacterium]|jgi:colicin import membrane protein|nr:TonB C-terminal domain-containing protein [Rhodanobacteraceae bacterium]
MESIDVTPRAVVFSALLHLGIVGFLVLAMLNCTRWERLSDMLHLPAAMRPVTCNPMVPQLEGPVIEATLVGPAGAPPPPASRHQRQASPRHEQKAEPKPAPPPAANVRVLPTPVPQPQLRDQEKIAQIAEQKAEQAKQAQEEQQKQRMAELTKEQEAERILKELAKVKAQSAAQQRRVNLEQQRAAQLADLQKSDASQHAQNVPAAKQAMTGQAGKNTDAYAAALTNAIVQNWLRPFDIPPGTVCPVEITQTRGGQVVNVKVLDSCPLNQVGRDSVEAAVRRAAPLPYKGFEKEFVPDLTLKFITPGQQ